MNEPTAIPHVLIVEDEQILQKFLVYHVEQAGYRATPLSQGAEIIDTIESQAVDLILLDLGLPDGDGLSRAQQVREHSNVPIIVLTGRQGEDDRIMALGLGADDYLTKPCDPRELLLRMRNLLERSGKVSSATASAPVLVGEPQSSVPPVAAQTSPDDGTRKKRQGDRRRPEKDRRVPEPAAAATSKTGLNFAVIGVAAVLFLAAGSGVTWFLLSGDDTAQGTATTKAARTGLTPPANPASKSAKQSVAPSGKAQAPGSQKPKTPQPSLSRTVTAQPSISPESQLLQADPKAPAVTPEAEGDRPLAATSYSWVLKAKCPPLPDVAWWRVKKHTDIVRYVNRRHTGDWLPYIKSWTNRLNKLRDILERNSGVKTKTGETLVGESLKKYVDQTQQRVETIKCLSRAAADYAYKRSQIR